MEYTAMAFVTDGAGNIFISDDGALSIRAINLDSIYDPTKNSEQVSLDVFTKIEKAFKRIVKPLAVLPCVVEEVTKKTDTLFFIIVADEHDINQKILKNKVSFDIVLDQYKQFLKESNSHDENIPMTNFFFDLKSKITSAEKSKSAKEFIENIASKSKTKNLTCPSCGSDAYRESMAHRDGSYLQKITCSQEKDRDCGFSMQKKEASAVDWKNIISHWELTMTAKQQ